MAISRAVKRERAVAPDLIAQVDAAIQALGSVPDPAARALASGHGSHVAVLIPLLSNALFVDLFEALQLRLRRARYQTLIGVTHYDAEEDVSMRDIHQPMDEEQETEDEDEDEDEEQYLRSFTNLTKVQPRNSPSPSP